MKAPLLFRRIGRKRVLKGSFAMIIETHCSFCPFLAASTDMHLIEMAEAAHHCAQLQQHRNRFGGLSHSATHVQDASAKCRLPLA